MDTGFDFSLYGYELLSYFSIVHPVQIVSFFTAAGWTFMILSYGVLLVQLAALSWSVLVFLFIIME